MSFSCSCDPPHPFDLRRDALVGVDAAAQALLALVLDAFMLAYLPSFAFFALDRPVPMGADAGPQTLLALAYARSAAFLAISPAALMLVFVTRQLGRPFVC